MSLMSWPVLFGAVLCCLLVPSRARAEKKSLVRFRLEAGPAFDRTDHVLGDRKGYAFAGGIELGRKLGLIVSGGYEHYAGDLEPYLAQTGQSGPIPPTVRVEGDVTKAAITGSLGLRLGTSLGALDGFVEFALGATTVMRHGVRWVDPSSGALVAGGGVAGSSVPLGEFGAGLRTRRDARFNWMLSVRHRQWAQLFEAGEEGKSVQVSLGAVTH